MIGRLTGRIAADDADGTAVIDVGGVGYELTVPIGTVGKLSPSGEGGAVTLYVHTHVREDAFLLYGFASLDERSAFRHLIGISSIGPKIAMNILGVLDVGELASVIARGELAKLTRVPGVGKKTAERIVLELKDKMLAPPSLSSAAASPARPVPKGNKAELLLGALTRMGFRPAEAERAVGTLGARVDSEPLGDLVREALASLSSR